MEHPGMKPLLGYAADGDTVGVWRIDRLGRSLIDVLNIVNLLRDRGVKIRSISGRHHRCSTDERALIR